MNAAEITCSNPDCRVAVDGKCVEGLTFDKCPYYGEAPQISVSQEDDEEGGLERNEIDLSLDPTLSAVGASAILRKSITRVIGIIGSADCGKTSIMAGLYDLFQIGRVGAASFAGSTTLHGLERICHDARVASKRQAPHSPRTPRGQVAFYHMDVHIDGLQDRIALLLADRSGEEYHEVADDKSNADRMFELRRADTVTLLVDGERLSEPKSRHDVMGSVAPVLQGLKEAGVFQRRPRLAIVLTKTDSVRSAPQPALVESDFARIVETIKHRFAEEFGDIAEFRTAASPRSNQAARGEGIPELLAYWLVRSSPEPVPATKLTDERVFSRLHPATESR